MAEGIEPRPFNMNSFSPGYFISTLDATLKFTITNLTTITVFSSKGIVIVTMHTNGTKNKYDPMNLVTFIGNNSFTIPYTGYTPLNYISSRNDISVELL